MFTLNFDLNELGDPLSVVGDVMMIEKPDGRRFEIKLTAVRVHDDGRVVVDFEPVGPLPRIQ